MPIERRRVLFLNSVDRPGADTAIQFLLMKSLDRTRVEVHAASPAGTASWELLRAIPDLHLRATNFGPSLVGLSSAGKLIRGALAAPAALGSLAALAAYIRKHRIEIVHSTDRPRDAVPCSLLARLTGARSLIHVHVGYGDWMSRGVRRALARADALVGVSQYVAGTLVKAGYRPERCHAVLNSIDPTGWDPETDPSPLRRELGLPAGAPVLVSISRLFHWKGQAELLRALHLVHRQLPETRLLIVGKDDDAGGPDRPNFTSELKALAAQLGLTDRVIFTGWRTDVARLLAACDLYTMPSFEEPFGLVYVEAMAMKRPVIALESGGVPEIVEHGKSGLLSQPRDIDGLAANIVTLLRDPALRARMGEHGRREVLARFTPARMAADAERVYQSLAGVR